jgi:hypothetical protein
MASIGRPDFLPASRLATPNGKKLTDTETVFPTAQSGERPWFGLEYTERPIRHSVYSVQSVVKIPIERP